MSAMDAPTPFVVENVLLAGDDLTSIWGVDDDTLFAVGTRGVHLDRVGGEWIRWANSPGRDYTQVWGTGRANVYAVGIIGASGSGFVEHFDGVQWSDEYVASTGIAGIWSEGTVVVAAGLTGTLYGKAVRNGTWAEISKITDPEPPNVVAVTGNGPSTMTVVGDRRVHHTLNFGDIQWLEPTVDGRLRFSAGWGAPGKVTDVLLGTNYLGIVWLSAPHRMPAGAYDASLLTPESSLDDLALVTVYRDESDPNAAALRMHGVIGVEFKRYLVGDRGRVYVFDVAAGALTTIPSGTTDSLYGVWASKESLWAVGSRELVLRAPRP